MKKVRIILMALFLIFSLSGCSWKDVYSSEGISIYRAETEEGKELYAEMSIVPVPMPEKTEEFLTVSEPVTEYEIQLSDGISYGYQGVENEETQVYAYTYGSLGEIADSLHLELLASDMVTYPESDKNFLYDLSVGKGAIFVRMDGAFYVWELEGIKNLDDLYEFADSIHWVNSSNR